jgi:hypothetical protein
MRLRDFIRECHKKEVFKNLSIYIVSSWVFIQVFSEIREPFGLPRISMTYLLLVLISGFPFYVYLIWRYRLKPAERESKREESMEVIRNEGWHPADNHPSNSRKHLPGIRFYSPFQKIYFAFLSGILLLSFVSVAWIVQANFISAPDPEAFTFPVAIENNKVAVLSFENNTMDADLDVVGKMAADWIIHGITRNEMAQVISPKVLEQYSTVMKASVLNGNENSILTDYLKPGKVISGNYYLNNGRLLIQCSIMDGDMNETLETFEPVSCDPGSPLTCIEQLKQRLLTALLEEDEVYTVYEEDPPNFEAYKLMLGANQYSNTAPEYLQIMNEAIALDPAYFEPKLHRITYYYNTDDFATADSLVRALLGEDLKNSRQQNLAKLWDALIRGDNKKAYTYLRNEYNIQPDDLNNNSSTMVMALQFVNRPQAVDSIYFTQLAMEKIDSLDCETCEFRFFSKGMADILLGNPQKPIEMFSGYGSVKGFYWIKDVLLYAYVRTRDRNEIDKVLNTIRLTGDEQEWREKCLLVARQWLIAGETATAHEYLGQLLDSLEKESGAWTSEERGQAAYAHFYLGDYGPAAQSFRDLSGEHPEDINWNAFLAMSLWKINQPEKSEEVMARLEGLRSDYQYGSIDYARARYYAFRGDENLVIQNLIRAVAAGKRYIPGTYQDDVLMQPYADMDSFQNVLTFWH